MPLAARVIAVGPAKNARVRRPKGSVVVVHLNVLTAV